ncbi:MAG TPA: hypothetical protein VI542_31860 [Candidatus Tectomicrobia bacterium]
MKGYVLTLCLLVGVVWSASAQKDPIDPKLVGTWETYDGPCSPCLLTIKDGGNVSFTQAGTDIQIVFSRGIPGPGIDLMFPQGGKADLVLSKSGHYLVGTYTNIWNQVRNNQTVSLTRK